MEIRLDKYVSSQGFCSRRKVAEFLAEHTVLVDGVRVTEPGERIDLQNQKIIVDGKKLSEHALEYWLVNKPRGYVTTTVTFKGQPSVLDLVKTQSRLYPVGRLDKDSEGLVLLTNDGELTYKLTHPKFHIAKTYQVLVLGNVTPLLLTKFSSGIDVDGVVMRAKVRIKSQLPRGKVWLEFVLEEGKKRQIREMCAAVNWHVERLIRTQIGSLELGNLTSGNARQLQPSELKKLKEAIQ